MIRRITRFEFILYLIAFLIALAVRLASIARFPLSDQEANLALQALSLAKGQETLLSPHPVYLVLSTVWMFLFGASSFTARFWPALAGSLLVLCPALFKKQLGRSAAVVLAFILVFDPGLLAISLEAGSPIFAILFFILFAAMLFSGRAALAGIFAGLALLSGPTIWFGLVSAGLVYLVVRWLNLANTEQASENQEAVPFARVNWRKFLQFTLVTLFMTSTLFFLIPQGISAFGAGLPTYLQGWVIPSVTPVIILLLGWIVYEFLLIFLGGWGLVTALFKKDPVDHILVVGWLVLLILALVYPGRQLHDLAWSLIALAALAARQVVRMLDVQSYDRLPTLGQAALAGLILGFISLTLFSMVNNPQFITENEYWVRLVGALVMLIASTGLIAWGWSKEVSLRGLVWGFSFILLIFTISAAWNVSFLSSRAGTDFWYGNRSLSEEDLLLETIDQITQWAPSQSGGLDLAVVGVPSPALKWSLRNVQRVEYSAQVPVNASPSLIITPEQPDLALAAPYRGQSYTLKVDTGWRYLSPQEWLRWMAFRVVPGEVVLKERIILWARTDLFPGDETDSLPELAPEPPQEEAE